MIAFLFALLYWLLLLWAAAFTAVAGMALWMWIHDRFRAARRVERVPGRVVSLELERARRRRTVA